jgi:salicylate hydroxylase
MNNSHPAEPFSVAVIGGGIGGLCLTIALLRRNIPVKVYEQAPEFKEIGLGIGLGPNSIAAMQLIDPAIAQSFKKLATDNASANIEEHFRTWINFRDGRANLPRLVAKVMTCDTNRTGICSARRAPFLDQLIGMVPKEICFFGKKLINIERLQNGTTILVFEDGSSAEADVVIGCDGIKSATRHLLFPGRNLDDFLTFTNDVAYRALLPMREAEQAISHDLAHNAQMYLFPGGHILTYPVDEHAAVNVIGVVRKESWEHGSWLLKDVQSEQVDSDFQAAGVHVKKLIKVRRLSNNADNCANVSRP